MEDLFELDYFSIIDLAWSVLCLVIILLIMNIQRKKYQELDYAEYYTLNVWMKVGLSLVYALYYILIVGGGDTLAYWDGAIKMNNLFWKDTSFFFEEIFSIPDMAMYYQHFDVETGLPPGWIYREPESWFVTKVMSFFTFFTFKSYLVATFVMAYISSIASWKLYQLVHSYGMHTNKKLAIAVLFMPSVAFWCSGITKDTIVLFCTIFVIYNAFQILSLDFETKWKHWLGVLVFGFILYQIRSFMLMTILLPLVFSYSVRLVKKYREKKFAFYMIRFLSFLLGILFFVFQGDQLTQSKELEEAARLNKDFATNLTYEGSHYDIGITDYTAQGMLQVLPAAIIAGCYRPFPWEVNTITMIANGLEDAYFLYLTFLFFRRDSMKKVNLVRKHEFLVFAFFFTILMAYMAGVTSGLLGVLVRFKAPVIPFLLILMTLDYAKYIESDVQEITKGDAEKSEKGADQLDIAVKGHLE